MEFNHSLPVVDFDIATAKLSQLRALLISVTSEGFDAFEGMERTLRHDLLWLASDLANEIHVSLVGKAISNASGPGTRESTPKT